MKIIKLIDKINNQKILLCLFNGVNINFIKLHLRNVDLKSVTKVVEFSDPSDVKVIDITTLRNFFHLVLPPLCIGSIPSVFDLSKFEISEKISDDEREIVNRLSTTFT